MTKKVLISAGGTGGHINAALSLAETFSPESEVIFLSGNRHLDFKLFKNQKCYHFNAKSLTGSSLLSTLANVFFNTLVFLRSLVVVFKYDPEFMIGAGGYVCGPTLLAGKLLGKPIFIIEQNAVAGVTNKILAKIAKKIFTSFKKTNGLEGASRKTIVTGNPIRKNIVFSKNNINEEIKILIYGGSLGAEQINNAIASMVSKDFKNKINILHQVGKGKQKVKEVIGANISYKQVEYIPNMNEVYSWSNIVIARAGASTISELRIIQRPSILIPYPQASHNHQHFNAINLKEENLFHVSILDNKLYNEDLSKTISKEINLIIDQKNYSQSAKLKSHSAENIKNEIKRCLG